MAEQSASWLSGQARLGKSNNMARYVYRNIDGVVRSIKVSDKARLRNGQEDLYGDHLNQSQKILNGYRELEADGKLYGPMVNFKSREYVKQVHEAAIAEGF